MKRLKCPDHTPCRWLSAGGCGELCAVDRVELIRHIAQRDHRAAAPFKAGPIPLSEYRDGAWHSATHKPFKRGYA